MTTPEDVVRLARWALRTGKLGVKYDPRHQDAEDMVMDAVVGGLRALRSHDGRETWSTYAMRSMRWEVIRGKRLRGGGAWECGELPPLSMEARGVGDDFVPGEGLALAEALAAPDMTSAGWRVDRDGVLALLSERDRELLDGTAEEIAARRGVKRAAVNKARVRLYARLREQAAS